MTRDNHIRTVFGKGWKRVNWELHGAVGFWTVALFAMWAITGIYFAFQQPFRSVVNSISPLTVVRAPESNPSLDGEQPRPEPLGLMATAKQLVPGAKMARFIPPSGPNLQPGSGECAVQCTTKGGQHHREEQGHSVGPVSAQSDSF